MVTSLDELKMVGPVDYVPELDDSDDDDDRDPGIFADPASPRHQFLIELVRMRDLPPECVLLRRDLTTTLNLSHRGLGDGVGEVLVKVLPKLPELGELLLADNRWTDVAIGAEIYSGQTSNLSRSVKPRSIWLAFGRIDRSRRVLEAPQKSSRRNRRSN